jgi:tetratricopeptide (TPR) repeat protein
MYATIDWSYNLLSAPEQRMFERLSAFAGGCTLAMAASVCLGGEASEGDALDLIASLVDKSLLTADREGTEPRFRLLESFRGYAREKLQARGERDDVALRHARVMLELADRLEHAFDYEADAAWLGLEHDELDNWRAAMQWALLDRGDPASGLELVGGLRVVWEYFAPLEGRRWLISALELADDGTPPGVLASLDFVGATVAWQVRDYEAQLQNAASAIARYQSIGDALGAAHAQCLAGYALTSLGRIPEARAVQEQALAAARQFRNPRLTAYILRCFGYFSALERDIVAARGRVTEALQIYKKMGVRFSAIGALADLSTFEYFAGNPESALAHATDALALVRRTNAYPAAGIYTLHLISEYLLALARYDEAYERARETLALAREHDLSVLAAWALQHLAAVAVLRARARGENTERDDIRAARLLGFVDARLASLGSAQTIISRQERERIVSALRDTMTAERLEQLMAAGASMTEDEAAHEALSD